MSNKKYPYYKVGEPTDLKDLIKYCADTFDEKTAFCYKKKETEIKVSFKQFQEDINALGTYLHNAGYKNAHIAVMGENSYEWIVSYFAIVNGGNVVVPIDKEATAEDIKFQLGKSDTVLLIHSNTYSDIAEFCDIESINMNIFSSLLEEGKNLILSGYNSFIDTIIDKERLCAIVFTSGTTAEPKGVMLNHKNFTKNVIVSSQNLLLPGETVAFLPFHHTFGFMSCILCQLLKGYTVYINNSLKRVFDDIKYFKPKHIFVVPMILISIYDKIWKSIEVQQKEKLIKKMISVSNILLDFGIDIKRILFRQVREALGGNLEMIVVGGAPIDEKYIKGFRDIGIKVINGYGITECSPIISTMRNKHYAPSSVGTILPEIEARIIDDELQIKGPTVFMGYYKNAVQTRAAFDGEWFKTGDLANTDEDGLLYITGRKKNLIILSNGKNIVPEEIEFLLMNNIPEIKEIVVYNEDNQITAEIFADQEITSVEEIIRSKIVNLNKTQPIYKHVTNIKFRNTEFKKTTTKKIKRNYSEVKND